MATTKHETVKDDRHLDGEEVFDDDRDFDSKECDSDDSSEEDPSYVVVEESDSAFLTRSLKRSKPQILKDDEEVESLEVKVPELDEKDKKSFEKIEEIIQAGQLERLKVDQCKVYLKKFGLRLTGKKDVLMERIKEHLEVRDGGGEKKYPISSFVLNCKGDACTGDVVMFEQNVYETYNVASRSATGPPCGTRTVAGRIVKESYGVAKQQHTFTIEVLWSKGEKPLLPLHPLLIKGRNLYRLKTMRQRWADEEERRKVLLEKHTRGHNARCSRETRVQEKEMRKMLGNMRIKKKECISSQKQSNQQKQNTTQNENQHPNIQDEGNLQQQKPIKCSEIRQSNNQKLGNHQQQNPIRCSEIPQPSIQYTCSQQQHYPIQQSLSAHQYSSSTQKWGNARAHQYSSSTQKWGNAILSPPRQQNHCVLTVTDQQHYQANGHMSPGFRYRQLMANANPSVWPLSTGFYQKQQPLTSCNSFRWDQATLNSTVQSPPYKKRWVPAGTQLCHYYLQGKCWYGNTCKYLHEK